ncbi:hypothetical protein FH972_023871 [Carpinus fangiana]|uniref:Myb-like domain-containing protein n=1 Tax=Carpinus fangiana TaxID=176857 RepID=A0A5N6KWX3_9ROSI|nr:hypothetical protein FH972_023871 [Carpinus fangiana]
MPRAPHHNRQHSSGSFAQIIPYTTVMAPSTSHQDQVQAVAHSSRDWLTPGRPSASWSPEDDAQLMSARQQGLNWQVISNRVFPGKTPNACRKRHERLMERVNAEDWDGIKLELLAKEYMEVRQEMWSILGERLHEKWNVIEAKCMEKGYKNLAAAARAANRRSIGTDDSGIAMDCDAERGLERERQPEHTSYAQVPVDNYASNVYARSAHEAAARQMTHQQQQQQHHQQQQQQQQQQHHHQQAPPLYHGHPNQYIGMPPHIVHRPVYQPIHERPGVHYNQAPSIASLLHPQMPAGQWKDDIPPPSR